MTDFCDQTANAGVYVRHVRGVNLGTWYYITPPLSDKHHMLATKHGD